VNDEDGTFDFIETQPSGRLTEALERTEIRRNSGAAHLGPFLEKKGSAKSKQAFGGLSTGAKLSTSGTKKRFGTLVEAHSGQLSRFLAVRPCH
jgi:hypothetical protein